MIRKILFCCVIILTIVNHSSGQVSFTSSNLPIIVINTNGQTIPDEPKITADMGIIYNGEGKRNNLTDQFNIYNGKIGIEKRGHSSQMFDKKQYGIELRNNNGNDIKVSILGMPEESDWVLNASYIDRSLLRNVLAYKLSNDLGRYASRTRYCELVLNGEYRGIYIIQEKIKRDKNRVDIKKINKTDNSGDALTGGYIIKIDRVDPGDKYWTSPYPAVLGSTKSPITYIIEYPKASDITAEQFIYIQNYVTEFEKIMRSAFYRDPFAGYYNYIDIDAFVDYYLINEFSKNTDAYRLSAFMYKNKDSEKGKLVMGPAWDFDISFGLADYDDGFSPSGWQALKHYEGLWNAPFWTTNLMIDPVFKNKLAKRWHELKNNILSTSVINNFIDENVSYLSEAQQRNFTKWNDLFNPLVYTWPNKNKFSNYLDEINYLKNWISQRSAWLDSNLPLDYSFVEWKTTDISKLNFEIGKELKLPVSFFIQSIRNVSSIKFHTLSSDIIINQSTDTISIKVTKPGQFIIRGVGLKGFDNVSISPEYVITVNTTSIYDDNQYNTNSLRYFQNYPNPFNLTTKIKFYLTKNSFTKIVLYNTLGKEVDIVLCSELTAGSHEIIYDSRNLTSGIYFCRIQNGMESKTIKMILLK
jgi:hypothetical protein